MTERLGNVLHLGFGQSEGISLQRCSPREEIALGLDGQPELLRSAGRAVPRSVVKVASGAGVRPHWADCRSVYRDGRPRRFQNLSRSFGWIGLGSSSAGRRPQGFGPRPEAVVVASMLVDQCPVNVVDEESARGRIRARAFWRAVPAQSSEIWRTITYVNAH